MADADAAESPLEAAAGAAGPHATEAFALLSNETRLAVLLALWEEYNPHGGENSVPFSRIFDRVDYDDPGNLRYHLEKLEGQFVRQHAERGGYELRETGLKFVQAVIAGAGVQDATLEATELNQPCPFCEAPTAISYHDGLVVHVCTACNGAGPEVTDADGFLSAIPFDPAGLVNRTAEEIQAASRVAALRQVQSLFDGLCPDCSGSVESWLERCTDHDSNDICEHCGKRFPVHARFQCRICKNYSVSPLQGLALFVPAVVAFYENHGVSTRVRADDPASVQQFFNLMDDHELELVSEEPPRAEVTAAVDGHELRLTFDETVSVVDVRP